ncbi:type II toxin-antitoxin system RelE/ParE family toxin [Rhodopirellula sp. JC740]|uniref:Type II toxin-antitoxin system RelE/ParE family toxin n=1 Tax=Rhodopirellula halodulae TaxID=2894198 RepID=A0ABS8NBP3_9BACT|nr:type II toxin-antitoxin system RelE/ParE family toxin [Rhodopirellula sp. JC740]MCC9640977.1 type II toxin-antitoxin system RelE/ParE family toxin [Rhodopirellula sp. JC740]
MARSLRYHPLFDSDVLNAAEWYDDRQAKLGTDFVSRVRIAVDSLIADPERRTSIDYGVRYWPVERFPYVVFYDLTDSEILVLGVMHTSQESRKWLAGRT